MATKYSAIPSGSIFESKGGKFRKLDDLYYEDLATGFQAVWNPMFDNGINTPATQPVANADNTKDKFLVDEQTRMVTANPNYKTCDGSAEKLFDDMWLTGLFHPCHPKDYEFIALKCIQAVRDLNLLDSVVVAPAPKKSVPAKNAAKKKGNK